MPYWRLIRAAALARQYFGRQNAHGIFSKRTIFIRPSASGTSLGGVAQKTRETIAPVKPPDLMSLLLKLSVGQSETVVIHDGLFLLLKLAGAGDELQGIKEGLWKWQIVL